MPFINKLLNSRNNNKNTDNKLPINFEIGTNNRDALRFGIDQVRILLFRECEWRGRKLLFDSVTSGKNNGSNFQKPNSENTGCPRNGNGLPQEHEKEACDNVSLLSELVFGTVAMTYRGPLFKIHTLDSPRCIMCTKVFPSPEHNNNNNNNNNNSKNINNNNSIIIDGNSSTGNTLSCPNSGNSLRKNSTSSSTCSGWDIELPRFESSQSLESSTSSGFGSYSSLPRRWLRAVSTSLNHSESDELFGFQHCTENSGDSNIFDNTRRHKTRLGLSVIIKLTPGQEKLMEIRLLEHAAQLEAILNRLSYTCIEKKRNNCSKKINESKLFIQRLRKASLKCTLWLVRLIVGPEKTVSPSIWHEILLNSTICTEVRTNILHRCFQQMSQLLTTIDTKTTNFFLSTLVTAILTYHLGWVNTVMSLNDKIPIENMKKNYPCNPLWTQLGDLYGTLGNPAKLVHTVIAGNSDKSTIINSILLFLSYFIRSAVVEKHYEQRESPETDVQDAIKIVEQKKKLLNTKKIRRLSDSKIPVNSSEACNWMKMKKSDNKESRKLLFTDNSKVDIPRLKKSSSINQQLDKKFLTVENKLARKLDTYNDEEIDDIEKENSSAVKIIVSSEKNVLLTSDNDDYEQKYDYNDNEMLLIATKLSFLEYQRNDSGFEATKSYASCLDYTDVYYSQIEYNDNCDKQNQVFFTLGVDDKTDDVNTIDGQSTCQCSIPFSRVPSTSAQLPEGVLRKILQRNFPESSKSIQRPAGTSFSRDKPFGFCSRCSGGGNFEGNSGKLLLETPTNATEVLRSCGNSVGQRGARLRRVDSLELLTANNVIEVPMPRSKKMSRGTKENIEIAGFTGTLLQNQISKPEKNIINTDSGYRSGLVIQGLIKNNDNNNNNKIDDNDDSNKSWLDELKDEVSVNGKFPMIDQSISEALCIIADTDNWQVNILSNGASTQGTLTSVGMSKLVSDMLEGFVYLWTKYHSPVHCLNILEFKLREMLLRSEALAEFLMTIDVCDVNLTNLTTALDIDAADVPLLLAVATIHSPQIAQRFGLTFT